MATEFPDWRIVHTLVFDFDGIFTDNKVIINQDGLESVSCDRGDGLAFDILKRFSKLYEWHPTYFILSKEKNSVVDARARKLGIKCIQGVDDKSEYLRCYLSSTFPRISNPFHGLIYFGNDLNDLTSMRLAGFSVAPSDSHPVILHSASIVLPQKGGQGFVRAAIEKIIRLDELPVDQIAMLV